MDGCFTTKRKRRRKKGEIGGGGGEGDQRAEERPTFEAISGGFRPGFQQGLQFTPVLFGADLPGILSDVLKGNISLAVQAGGILVFPADSHCFQIADQGVGTEGTATAPRDEHLCPTPGLATIKTFTATRRE